MLGMYVIFFSFKIQGVNGNIIVYQRRVHCLYTMDNVIVELQHFSSALGLFEKISSKKD